MERAFERIGFKNAIAAKPYPKDDPEFDPDNIKYSCIRYAPIAIANAMGPSWVDPRSGEIPTPSVYVYHDMKPAEQLAVRPDGASPTRGSVRPRFPRR